MCNACPLKGLQCQKEEEKGEKKEEEKERVTAHEYVKGPKLPCDKPPEDGFMWAFESSEGEWRYLAFLYSLDMLGREPAAGHFKICVRLVDMCEKGSIPKHSNPDVCQTEAAADTGRSSQ